MKALSPYILRKFPVVAAATSNTINISPGDASELKKYCDNFSNPIITVAVESVIATGSDIYKTPYYEEFKVVSIDESSGIITVSGALKGYDSYNTEKTYVIINKVVDGLQEQYQANNVEIIGNALSLDGSTQYAYHTNIDTLDMGNNDFAVSALLNTSSATIQQICRKSDGTIYYYIRIENDGNIRLVISDGTNSLNAVTIGLNIVDGKYHYITVLISRSAPTNAVHFFVDGYWRYSIGDASIVGNITNSGVFYLGSATTTTEIFNGNIDEGRLFVFGVNGLYITGTGGANLEIKVGNATGDTIYSEVSPYSSSHPSGMIPAIYRSPSVSLSDLGYESLENASRTELHDGAGSVTGMVIGKWYYFIQGTAGHDLTVGASTYTSDAAFVASTTTGTILTGDANDSVKGIGEIAHWVMDETGTPATLADGTSNNLNLTTIGSPSMVKAAIPAWRTQNLTVYKDMQEALQGTQSLYAEATADNASAEYIFHIPQITDHIFTLWYRINNGQISISCDDTYGHVFYENLAITATDWRRVSFVISSDSPKPAISLRIHSIINGTQFWIDDMMGIGSIIKNGSFELGTTFWQGVGTAQINTDADAVSGNNALIITGADDSNNNYVVTSIDGVLYEQYALNIAGKVNQGQGYIKIPEINIGDIISYNSTSYTHKSIILPAILGSFSIKVYHDSGTIFHIDDISLSPLEDVLPTIEEPSSIEDMLTGNGLLIRGDKLYYDIENLYQNNIFILKYKPLYDSTGYSQETYLLYIDNFLYVTVKNNIFTLTTTNSDSTTKNTTIQTDYNRLDQIELYVEVAYGTLADEVMFKIIINNIVYTATNITGWDRSASGSDNMYIMSDNMHEDVTPGYLNGLMTGDENYIRAVDTTAPSITGIIPYAEGYRTKIAVNFNDPINMVGALYRLWRGPIAYANIISIGSGSKLYLQSSRTSPSGSYYTPNFQAGKLVNLYAYAPDDNVVAKITGDDVDGTGEYITYSDNTGSFIAGHNIWIGGMKVAMVKEVTAAGLIISNDAASPVLSFYRFNAGDYIVIKNRKGDVIAGPYTIASVDSDTTVINGDISTVHAGDTILYFHNTLNRVCAENIIALPSTKQSSDKIYYTDILSSVIGTIPDRIQGIDLSLRNQTEASQANVYRLRSTYDSSIQFTTDIYRIGYMVQAVDQYGNASPGTIPVAIDPNKPHIYTDSRVDDNVFNDSAISINSITTNWIKEVQ